MVRNIKTIFNSRKPLLVLMILIMCLLNISCLESPKKLITGFWALESLIYEGEDIFEKSVLSNMLFFGADNTFGAPMIESALSNDELSGHWRFIEPNKLELKNKTKYLDGIFTICFKEDKEKGYLVMELSNNDLLLSMGKILSPSEFILIPLNCND